MAAPAGEKSIFDGVDVTIPGLATLVGLPAGSLSSQLQAIDAAPRYAKWAKEDADFESIRDDPKFAAAIERHSE